MNLQYIVKQTNINSLINYYSLFTREKLYSLGKTGISEVDEKLNLEGESSLNKYLLDALIVSLATKSDISRPIITQEANTLLSIMKPEGIIWHYSKEDKEKSIEYLNNICKENNVIESYTEGEAEDIIVEPESEDGIFFVEDEDTENYESELSKNSVEDEDIIEDIEISESTAIYSSFISNKVSELLECYKALYEICYVNKRPIGVLTSEGIYTLNGQLKNTNPESKAELSMVYKVLNDSMGELDEVTGFSHRVSPKEIENCQGKPLYINYHLANMYGYFGNRSKKSTSFSEFSKYIEERTKKILRKLIEDLSEDERKNRRYVEDIILKYRANLKNCILVDEYEPGVVLKLRIAIDSSVYNQEYNNLNENMFNDIISSGYLFKKGTTVSSPSKCNDVFYLNFIVDSDSYYNSPLFAYEALPILKEQGIELSWNNILIGKDVKDELVFGKFGAEQKTIYNIMAGSGSGKGVMTLSMLASALAANIPIMYADCKPEMAEVLWKTAKGRNVLAFDGDPNGILPQVEAREDFNIYEYFNKNIPEPIKDFLLSKGLEKKFVKTYCYLRCIHLAYLISVMRKEEGVKPDDFILFVFDEIGRVSENIKDLIVSLRGEGEQPKGGFIEDRITELKGKGASKLDIAKDESLKYVKDFFDYSIGVITNIVTAKTAELRLANSKLLFIWQPDWLAKASLGSISSKYNKYYFMSVVYKLVTDSNTVKFAGKGSDKSGPLGMSEVYNTSKSNAQLFDDYRYFALAESGEVTKSSKVFRPFLLLTDASEVSAEKCAGTNPLARPKLFKNGLNGEVIPEVGFEGYVNTLLGSNIQEPLCRSWDIALEALEKLGYEKDIFKFMYDVSDLRLNLSNTNKEPDSREDFSKLLAKASREDNFSNEEELKENEDARLKIAMGDYDDFFNINNTSKSSTLDFNLDEEFDLDDPETIPKLKEYQINNSETLSETQKLINELSEKLGADVGDILTKLGYIDGGNAYESYSEPPIPKQNDDISLLLKEENLKLYFENANSYQDSIDIISEIVTKDIITKFGGVDRIKVFQVRGGSIAINKVFYRCRVSKDISQRMPFDVASELNSGNITSLFDYQVLRNCTNISAIEIDSLDFWYEVVSIMLDVSLNNLDKIFYKVFPKLRVLRVGGKSYTRDELESNKESLFSKAERQNNYANKRNISGINSFVYNQMTKGSYSLLKRSIQTSKLSGIKKTGAIIGSGTLLLGSTAANVVTGTANLGWKVVKSVKNLFK